MFHTSPFSSFWLLTVMWERKKKAFNEREGGRWEVALVEERREMRENKQA